MDTLFIGQNFLDVPSLGSTNSYALDLLRDQPPEGMVIRTADQPAGRGQQGSQWVSEPHKNLTFSIILYPKALDTRQSFALNRAVACALHETVAAFLPQADPLRIKWPNDLLYNHLKLAGILIENQMEGSKWKSSVVGIGLNVNQRAFPAELEGVAGSMATVAGRDFALAKVLDSFLLNFEARYLALRQGRTAPTEDYFLHHLYGYQERGRFRIKGELREALLVGVDAEGRLALEIDGRLHRFHHKELAFCLESSH